MNVMVPDLPVNTKEESVKPSNIDQLAVSNSLTTTTPSLLASGERVLLQTATVLVQPPDGMASATAHVLLDSASQRTFMTNNLAKQLNLRSEHQELLSVSTFGASKATDLSTYVVQFKVKLKDGTNLSMFANVLPQFTGNIQRTPLLQKDIEFLDMLPREKLADFIPCALETTHIDLLIGSNYFWDIVGGDKIVLPSEMFMIPSGLGYIITGKCPEIASVHQDGNLGTLWLLQGYIMWKIIRVYIVVLMFLQ